MGSAPERLATDRHPMRVMHKGITVRNHTPTILIG